MVWSAIISQGIAENYDQPTSLGPKIAVALAAAILLAKASVAATFTVHALDGEGRVFVDVLGTINDGDFKAFQEKTDQIYLNGQPKKPVIVTLLSYGGSIGPALQIAELIRKRGMSTFVPSDRACTRRAQSSGSPDCRVSSVILLR